MVWRVLVRVDVWQFWKTTAQKHSQSTLLVVAKMTIDMNCYLLIHLRPIALVLINNYVCMLVYNVHVVIIHACVFINLQNLDNNYKCKRCLKQQIIHKLTYILYFVCAYFLLLIIFWMIINMTFFSFRRGQRRWEQKLFSFVWGFNYGTFVTQLCHIGFSRKCVGVNPRYEKPIFEFSSKIVGENPRWNLRISGFRVKFYAKTRD